VSRCQKGKTNLDFTEARDSERQWHQLDHMQVCTSLQTDNHASTPPLSFLQAGRPYCRPTNSVKALKAQSTFANGIHVVFSSALNASKTQLLWLGSSQVVDRVDCHDALLLGTRVAISDTARDLGVVIDRELSVTGGPCHGRLSLRLQPATPAPTLL